MISWVQAAVLGVVQGLTEFLPISSNAHLRIVSAAFGWADPGAAFTAVTQLGTESAVIIYFARDIARIVSTWARSLVRPELRGDPDARMGWYVIIGTLPIGVLGLLLQNPIEDRFRDLRLIGLMLVLFALVIGWADATAKETRTLERLTLRHAVAFGFAQALALIPGVSRSGGTISAGLLLGYTRVAAARYSFLLAIPAVLTSGLFELRKIGGQNSVAWGPTILATVIAFAVGFAVIIYFLRFISTHTFRLFVWYRIVLGLSVIALVTTGVLSATG